MILRKPNKKDFKLLYNLVKEENVIKYVRHKPTSLNNYLEIMDMLINSEEKNELISRVIVINGEPIGTISLFDISYNNGFLATWIGNEYQGKGYNQMAKDLFFKECYTDYNIETIFMKIRKENIKSQKSALKMHFVEKACSILYIDVYKEVNKDENIYELFFVNKEIFLKSINQEETILEKVENLIEHCIEESELILKPLNNFIFVK